MALEISIAPPAQLPPHLHDPLIARGFVHEGRACRQDGLSFAVEGQWYVLREQASGQGEWSLSLGMGQPGLWKWVQNGAPLHRVCELPAWVVSGLPEEDRFDGDGPATFSKLLDWALESRYRRVLPDWQSPASDLVASWISRGALTVQAAGLVRQGELILRPDCWALRVPVLPRLPGDLPEPRRRALEELVFDAQCRWAMVRLGVPADANIAALVAEVDLTGAPHSELLFSAGLDVLRHVVAWLVETAEVLADPSVAIACLAPGGDNTTNPNERNTP